MEAIAVPTLEVSLEDMEIFRAAVNSAYMQSMAHDLCEQYRKLSNRQQYSALTKALERTLLGMEAYIQTHEEANAGSEAGPQEA